MTVVLPCCPRCNEELPLPLAVGSVCPDENCAEVFGVESCEYCNKTENLQPFQMLNWDASPKGEPVVMCAGCIVGETTHHAEQKADRAAQEAKQAKAERARVNKMRGIWQDANSRDLAGELPPLKSVKGATELLCPECRAIARDDDAKATATEPCACRCSCGLRFKFSYRGRSCDWCDARHGGEYGHRDDECGRSNLVCDCEGKAERRARLEALDRGEEVPDDFEGEADDETDDEQGTDTDD